MTGVWLSLQIYLVVAVVSLACAAMLKGIVWVLGRTGGQAAAPAKPAPARPATIAPAAAAAHDPRHVAAIMGAVQATLGGVHVVHIESGRGAGWTAEGRWQHQTSHNVSHHLPSGRPKR